VIRVAALAAVLIVAAYVTLPLWAPTGLIKAHLAEKMSRQMGVDVRIAEMSLSWTHGIRLRKLTIASPEGFSDRPMVVIANIRADLSPVDLFFRKQVAWLELEQPQAYLQIDADGNANLAPLSKLRFDAEARRISVHLARATVRLPHHDKLLRINISDAEFVAGRVQKLGRVTVSALLDQQDGGAPVSLRLGAGSGEQAVAADALFNFANIDLAQLQLPQLLGLPLQKLSGLCRGSLNLQINRQGVIDRFGFNLTIRKLDVQPSDGPRLPVIDEAGFRITAAYDPLTGHLDIQSASVRLPGIDLAGRASLFADVGRGHWQAIEAVELDGTVYPRRLAVLLNGRRELAGGVQVEGPLRLRLSVTAEKRFFTIGAAINGDAAVFQRAGRIIKPAGRRLRIDLRAGLDGRIWRLAAAPDAIRLELGDNTFRGGGSVRHVRDFLRLLRNGRGLRQFLAGLALVEGRGTWEIREPGSLQQAAGLSALAIGPVNLRGRLAGTWSIEQHELTRLELGCSLRPQDELTVGNIFRKPSNSPLGLSLSAQIDPDRRSARQIAARLSVGDGQLEVADATVSLLDGPGVGPYPAVDAQGRLRAVNIESILAHIPALDASRDGEIRGRLTGNYRIRLAGGQGRVSLQADLKNIGIAWKGLFRKPAGDAGKISIDLLRDESISLKKVNRLAFMLSFDEAKIAGEAVLADGSPADSRMKLSANIKDARWLVESCPPLHKALGRGELAGPLELVAEAVKSADSLSVSLKCRADDLEFASSSTPRRAKSAGAKLRIQLDGTITSDSNGHRAVEISELGIDLAGSRLSLAGSITLATSPRLLDAAAVKELKVAASGTMAIDEPLVKLVPELGEIARKYGLAGTVAGYLQASRDSERMSLAAKIDAKELSVERLGPFDVASSAATQPGRGVSLGPFTKQAGLPATASLELTAPRDWSWVQANNLELRVGDVRALADAKVLLERRADRWPGRPTKADCHLAVWVNDARPLHRLAPFLKPYQLGGSGFLEFQLVAADDDDPRITSGTLQADRLRGRYRGKNVLIDGTIDVRDVVFERQGAVRIARVQTDGLELRAGENQCWLMADLADLPDRPSGTLRLLATTLDDKDLMDWLGDEQETAARSRPASRLSGKEAESLRKEARDLLVFLRTLLSEAKVSGRVSIDRFKTYDPSVSRGYEVRNVEASVSVDRGRLQLGYVAGLNGGTLSNRYDVRLNDATPIAAYKTSMRDVIATENIQPQLAKYFPGNTVYGIFNRQEESTIPLESLLANALDYRYPLHPTGRGKTITTDGLIEGRAAPKFVTNVFPGLNLAKYRYKKMTSFAKFRPDGVAENDMVFSGHTYDMYIEGTTDAENIGRYEIGIILLGTPQSAEWNHLYRQGRIPILKLKARIEGGKMHDEQVSYFWPNQTLFVIFLKNNIFFRIWLAAQAK